MIWSVTFKDNFKTYLPTISVFSGQIQSVIVCPSCLIKGHIYTHSTRPSQCFKFVLPYFGYLLSLIFNEDILKPLCPHHLILMVGELFILFYILSKLLSSYCLEFIYLSDLVFTMSRMTWNWLEICWIFGFSQALTPLNSQSPDMVLHHLPLSHYIPGILLHALASLPLSTLLPGT